MYAPAKPQTQFAAGTVAGGDCSGPVNRIYHVLAAVIMVVRRFLAVDNLVCAPRRQRNDLLFPHFIQFLIHIALFVRCFLIASIYCAVLRSCTRIIRIHNSVKGCDPLFIHTSYGIEGSIVGDGIRYGFYIYELGTHSAPDGR